MDLLGEPGDWYFEAERGGFAHGIRVRERLASFNTGFQDLEILDTEPFGRVLVLDRALQTSEFDEFMYHEMLVHVPLMSHPAPRRVLIVGGGDGGALRHVLQHPNVDVVQVEIDRAVVDTCREYLPSVSGGSFESPRARLVIGDGIAFMRENPAQFDVIIVDSTDPIGPAVGLFGPSFYEDVARSLCDDGLLAAQSSSPLFMAYELKQQVQNMRRIFPLVRTYLGIVPGYPGSLWSYTIGSKRHDPTRVARESIAERLARGAIPTRYYTPDVHHAAFALPPFIADILE